MNKLTSFFKVSAALLLAFVLSLSLFTNGAFALPGFSQTCSNSHLEGSTLYSTCKAADGSTTRETSINLNDFIGNIDGELKAGSSNFRASCEEPVLVSPSLPIMVADCETRNKAINTSFINLDDYIFNAAGTLTLRASS